MGWEWGRRKDPKKWSRQASAWCVRERGLLGVAVCSMSIPRVSFLRSYGDWPPPLPKKMARANEVGAS